MGTIELIESDLNLIENISELLVLDGYDVKVAKDCNHFKEDLKYGIPDLVIFDTFNSIDCSKIIAELYENYDSISFPIVVLCCGDGRNYLFADEVLPLPFNTDDLLSVVRKYLNK